MLGASSCSPRAIARMPPTSWSAGASLSRNPLGPGHQGVVDQLRPVEGGQHDDPGIAGRRGDAPGGLDPVQPGHPDVHQHDVGAGRPGEVDGLATVGGLAHHGEVVLGAEDHPEPRPHELLVVGEEDRGHGTSWGMTALTRKPPSSQGPHSSRPPAAATVSARPASPAPLPPPRPTGRAGLVHHVDAQRAALVDRGDRGGRAGRVPGHVDEGLADDAEGHAGRGAVQGPRHGHVQVDAHPPPHRIDPVVVQRHR